MASMASWSNNSIRKTMPSYPGFRADLHESYKGDAALAGPGIGVWLGCVRLCLKRMIRHYLGGNNVSR